MKLELTLDTLPALTLMRLLDDKAGYEGLENYNVVSVQFDKFDKHPYTLTIEGPFEKRSHESHDPREFLTVLYGVVNDYPSDHADEGDNLFRFVKRSWTSELVDKLKQTFTGKDFDFALQAKPEEDGECTLEMYVGNPKLPGFRIARHYDGNWVAHVLSTAKVNGDVFGQVRCGETVSVNTETDAGRYDVQLRSRNEASRITVEKAEVPIDGSHFKGYEQGKLYSAEQVNSDIVRFVRELFRRNDEK